MVRFLENYSLKSANTFGFDCKTQYYFEFTDSSDLLVFLNSNKSWHDNPLLVLGGGSNFLFTGDFGGLVIRPNIPGIKVLKENRQNVWIEAGAGEIWDEFVQYCVDSGFGGLENLSLIPGTVGAAPVQNIGAYGCEASRCIEEVKGINLNTLEEQSFLAGECRFGYRDSIFKNELKGKFITTSVIFKLDKFPEYILGYGDVDAEVKRLGGVNLQNVRQAVVNIRSVKLPDVKVLGNAGSFFKNPAVEAQFAAELKGVNPGLPVYPAGEGFSKLAAGWLIEHCGWKGFRDGDAGVHDKQALVLVNYGNASGAEIFRLSEKIKKSVFEKFGVTLDREVNVV